MDRPGRAEAMMDVLVNVTLALPLVGAYSMFALGIVLTYRASRVLNLAQGAMATAPAYVAYSLAKAGVPVAVALAVAVACGAAIGLAVERWVLRPLRGESQTAQTVGTVAVLGLLIALVAKVWGTEPLRAAGVFPDGSIPLGGSVIQYGEIGIIAVSLVTAAAVALLFARTDIGLAMRGAAENRRAASLMGVDPDRTTAIAWAMSGALAAAAGVMLAATTSLHPFTLSRQVLPAFVAGLIGGLESIPGGLIGSAIVGVVTGVVSSIGPLGSQPGSAQLVLAVVALVVMAVRGKRHGTAADAVPVRAEKPRRKRRFGVRARVAVAAGTALVLAWPWLPIPRSFDSLRGDANQAALYVVVAVSIVVLTGWVGQISLAQASFVGVAAFTTGVLARSAHVAFPFSLPLAAGVAAAVATVLGVVALRVRGLYLAVATLIFGWMADAYLFKATWFAGEGGSASIGRQVVGREGAFPSFDLSQRRIFWYVAVAAAALAVAAAANLRDSKTGRAFFAVRGSETAAASLGINVTRTKLLAFAVSGLLAGVAGNLLIVDHTVVPADFGFSASLLYLSIAVVGGLTRLGGVVVASLGFAMLNEVFFRVHALNGYLDLVSSAFLLTAVMLSAEPVRARLTRFRRPQPGVKPVAFPATLRPPLAPAAATRRVAGGGAVLEADRVTVRFGGLVAADDVSFEVRDGEIVGLIGPNGAGKTTLFNAVSGLVVPTEGRVRLFGRDATRLGVHERAAAGLGRTFQVVQLLPGATVFENLMVATHLHSRAGVLSHLFVTDRAARDERDSRDRVTRALEMTGLTDLAEARAGDLPFGMLRMIEIARAIVTGSRLIMLDEPASGLDERETDRLGDLLLTLRDAAGCSLLIVEHDVRFVTRLSDRMYVLDRGRIIARGAPDVVRSDPAVIAAYLGEPVQPVEPQKAPALA